MAGGHAVSPHPETLIKRGRVTAKKEMLVGLLDMRESSLRTGDAVRLMGIYDGWAALASPDRAAGVVRWNASREKAEADGVTIYDPSVTGGFDGTPATIGDFHAAQGTGTGTGVWERADVGPIDIAWAGVVADNATNDAPALSAAKAAALASGRSLYGEGTILLSDTVNLRDIEFDFSNLTINIAHAGMGVVVGGSANKANNPNQYIKTVVRTVGSDSQITPSVRCIGAKGQYVTVEFAGYFQLYADTESGVAATDSSSAYSSFWLRNVKTVELTNNPDTDGSSIQWLNENKFYLDRTKNLLINGTYTHNHNKFYNGTFEGVCSINIETGYDNVLYGARFEYGATTINFGATTARNTIYKTWSSSFNSGGIFDQLINGTITDSGQQNQVIDERSLNYSKSVVAEADTYDVVVNNLVGVYSNRDTQLQKVSAIGNSNHILAESEFLPVVPNDVYEFDTESFGAETLRYRPSLEFYDENYKPVADATGYVTSPTITAVSGNIVITSTGVSGGRAIINQAAVDGAKYLKVTMRSSFGQAANALAKRLRASRYTQQFTSNLLPVVPDTRLTTVSAVPTRGFAPVGYACHNANGLESYYCAFALDDGLAAGATSGATSITVSDGLGSANGDIIGINQDDGSTHWTTVASGGGTTSITLTVGLTENADSGSRAVFNRWVTRS